MKYAASISTIILTLSFIAAFGQDKAKLINDIRKEFNSINSDTTFKKIVLENEEFLEQMTDGGGELTGFYKAGQIKKIVSWVGISTGYEILEFYFKDSKLIFVYKQFYSFVYDDKTQTRNFDSTRKIFEGRYYFYHNKLIDQATTGYDRFRTFNINAEKAFLTEADYDRKLLDRKLKNSL